jgi:hypothetical protein
MKQIDEATVTIPLSRYNEIVKIDEFLNKGMSAGRRQTFRTEFLSKDEHLNVVTKERIEIEEAFIELINEKARLEEDVLNQIRSKSIFELIKIKLT